MPRVAITGAAGYVGSALARRFTAAGWLVLALGRTAAADMRYELGEAPPADWAGIDALVHCAYDFQAVRRAEIQRVNVQGSIRLLEAAHAGGVKRGVFISSLSCFEGCRSLYGQAKLEVEREALRLGFAVIRPGLVHGPEPGGMMGSLEEMATAGSVIPLIGDGSFLQYPVHEDDLAEAVFQLCRPETAPPGAPLSAAASQAITLRELLRRLAGRQGREPRMVPVPWRLILAGLRAMEILGLHPPFRSDSLIGFVYQNPAPDFAPAARLGLHFRPFP